MLCYVTDLRKSTEPLLVQFKKRSQITRSMPRSYRGSRWETLLIAQILLAFNVRIIHHSGGDLTSGSLDNSYRYACSMLASVHWVSTELHGQRLINLGIPKDQIYFVGEPQLETKYKKLRGKLSPKAWKNPPITSTFQFHISWCAFILL